MSGLPTKRILVYVAIGLVVMVVGAIGLVSARGSSNAAGGVVIDTDLDDGWSETLSAVVGVDQPGRNVSTTTEAADIWVQVAGAVNVPGVYRLLPGSRVFEAVAAAGDFREDADEQAVALAAQLFDGCRVYVPRLGETVPGGVVGPAESSAGLSGDVAGGGATGGLVSLNSASTEELDTLPGIGPSLAQQIVSYREAQGPFRSIDQLTEVPGIGPAKLELIRPLVVL